MKKGYIIAGTLGIIISLNTFCVQNNRNDAMLDYTNKADVTIVEDTTTSANNDDQKTILLEEYFPTDFQNNTINIFLEGLYREYEPEELQKILKGDWYDFYKDSNQFVLKKSEIDISKVSDDCLATGAESTYMTSLNSIFLIKGLTNKDKQIEGFEPKNMEMIPGESFNFTFKGVEYSLKASCIFEDTENQTSTEKDPFKAINYRLYLETSNNKQLLIVLPRTQNFTFVQTLFIGDLDEDGKPDFIFDVSTFYEEKTLLLYMSSPAKNNQMVVPIDIASYQFDC